MLESIRKEPDEEERPRPNIKKLRDILQGPFGIRSVALTGLFVLALFYTLYLARSFFLPIILAILLSFLLTPLMRGLKKLRIPSGLGAAILVFGLLGLIGVGVYELADPALEWMEQAPRSFRNVERKLREFKKPVQTMSRATEQVEKMTQVTGGGKSATVTVQTETLGEKLFSRATDFVANGMIMFILLYFLLASGDMFLRKLIRVMPSLSDKKRAVEIARQIETEISAYLSMITLINVLLGLAVWGIMSLIGIPNPLLWGVLATFTNYIPYLGAIIMIIVLAMVGFITFDDIGQALLAPGAFVGLNILESYILTQLILCRRLTLNPVVIFLGLTFWGWLWGITGAVLAVPIMVVLKIFCDHSEALASVGEFMGGE
ncbi:MAG TPA: AI-2E family transporter [Thermoanaerobaculia bacterium]|nr:AI-2E family transporter [Thermoanaerobaculia bacterium]